jgi:hypothetical protein
MRPSCWSLARKGRRGGYVRSPDEEPLHVLGGAPRGSSPDEPHRRAHTDEPPRRAPQTSPTEAPGSHVVLSPHPFGGQPARRPMPGDPGNPADDRFPLPPEAWACRLLYPAKRLLSRPNPYFAWHEFISSCRSLLPTGRTTWQEGRLCRPTRTPRWVFRHGREERRYAAVHSG